MNLRDIFLAGAFAQGGGGAVSPEQITEAVNNYLDKNPVGVDLAMTGAAVGQIAKITAVDASGVPTAWEPVDMPKGEEWELIKKITIPDDWTEWQYGYMDINEYRKVNIFFNRVFSNNDTSAILVSVNGVGLDYISSKTTPTQNALVSLSEEGHVVARRSMWTSNYNGWPGAQQFSPRQDTADWTLLGEKLNVLGISMSASAYAPAGGTVEIYGVKR